MSKTQWYAKSSYLLVALALVLSLGLLLVPTVSAAPDELHVGPGQTYTKIQDALNDANEWDEIIVHPATYSTATNGETFPLVVKDNNLLIRSTDGAASTIIDAGGAQTNILKIDTYNNVDVDGFTLRNAVARYWYIDGKGLYMEAATNCDISNLKIYDISGSESGESFGIFMENGSDDNTFTSIEIYNITSRYVARGIWEQDSYDNTFTDIHIHDVSVSNRYNSEFAVFGIHLSSSDGNTFDEITIDDINGGDWGEGIELQESNGNTFGDLSISHVTAAHFAYGIKLGESSDNTFGSSSEIWHITDGEGDGVGIGVERDNGTGSNNNTFEAFDIHDTYYGFYISKSDDNFITKSNIHDNVEGVHLCSATGECVGNRLHCNNIYGNTNYGVYKEFSPDVDATGNWWGDSSGPSLSPGSGDEISANVLYDPWLPDVFEYCEECGGVRRPPPGVPTVNDWGIVAMITLFAGLLVWTVQRRRLAS